MALSNHDGTWTLTHGEYLKLKDRDAWLSCLEAAGVDNWNGMDYAIELYNGDEGDLK